VATAALPDTILKWYRGLVARKFDGSCARRAPGRSSIGKGIEELIVRMAEGNRSRAMTQIVGALANLIIKSPGFGSDGRPCSAAPRSYAGAQANDHEGGDRREHAPDRGVDESKGSERHHGRKRRPRRGPLSPSRSRHEVHSFLAIIELVHVKTLRLPAPIPNSNEDSERSVRSAKRSVCQSSSSLASVPYDER
jgi:hypothetical protein